MSFKTDFTITTNHLIAGAVLIAGGVVVYKAAKAAGAGIKQGLNAVNPASQTNIVNRAASAITEATVGRDVGIAVEDKFFAALDLVNPFNESDEYAKKVWGLGERI